MDWIPTNSLNIGNGTSSPQVLALAKIDTLSTDIYHQYQRTKCRSKKQNKAKIYI